MSKETQLIDELVRRTDKDEITWTPLSEEDLLKYKFSEGTFNRNFFAIKELNIVTDSDYVYLLNGTYIQTTRIIDAINRKNERIRQKKIADKFVELGFIEKVEEPSNYFKLLFWVALILLIMSWFPITAFSLIFVIFLLSFGSCNPIGDKWLHRHLPFGVFKGKI